MPSPSLKVYGIFNVVSFFCQFDYGNSKMLGYELSITIS